MRQLLLFAFLILGSCHTPQESSKYEFELSELSKCFTVEEERIFNSEKLEGEWRFEPVNQLAKSFVDHFEFPLDYEGCLIVGDSSAKAIRLEVEDLGSLAGTLSEGFIGKAERVVRFKLMNQEVGWGIKVYFTQSISGDWAFVLRTPY